MSLDVRIGRDAVDVDVVHGWLSRESYWAAGIPRAAVERALDHSICFSGYVGDRQVAFARVVTDCATFAYLADVFVLEDAREQGISARLMDAVLAHPGLQGLRRFMLATRDAHGLYARYGFAPPAHPDSLMERYAPGVYAGAS